MRVRMLRTTLGAMDVLGVRAQLHSAGEVLDLPGELAEVYLREGWAEQDKAMGPAPEAKDAARRGGGRGRRMG